MKLEEAKEIIENEIDGCDVFSCEMCKRDCTCDNSPCVEEGCQLAIAVDTVFQELEHLQKENEKLKSRNEILECCKYVDSHEIIKAKLEESERWRNKIRIMIEEIKARMNDDCIALHEFQRIAKIDVLEELLEEE